MLPALAFLANPAFYSGVGSAAGALSPLTGIFTGAGGKSTAPATVVDVKQNVSQSQSLNIGSQSDIAEQLAYLIGAVPSVQYPDTSGGEVGNIADLFNSALGMDIPTGGSIGDSRYSTATGGITAKKSNLNLYLIIGGVIIIAVLFIRKRMGR